jgi:hypothetical protein
VRPPRIAHYLLRTTSMDLDATGSAGGVAVSEAPASAPAASPTFTGTLTVPDAAVTPENANSVRERLAQLRAEPSALTQAPQGTVEIDGVQVERAHVTETSAGPVQGEDGRWRNPDGTFAPPPVSESAPEMQSEAAPVQETATAAEPLRIALPGREGQEELEIEVDDPATAERLRMLRNGYMRGEEARRQITQAQQERQQVQVLESMLREAPELLVENMPPAMADRMLRHLLATRLEAVAPDVEALLTDPVARAHAQVAAIRQTQDARTSLDARSAAQRHADALLGAAEALVPADVDDETARAFLRDAERDLMDAVAAGAALDARTVPTVLARRAQQYGFASGGSAPAPTARAVATARPVTGASAMRPAAGQHPAVARPVGAAAEALAAGDPVAAAKAQQARLQRAAQTHQMAAAIAPGAGASALPSNRPPEPEPQHTSVKDHLAALRRRFGGK